MKVLELDSLKAYYDKAMVLRGIDMYLDDKETVAVLGPNGAGKTTLLRSIVGLVRVEGDIKFNGVPINKLKPYERINMGIAICPEGRHLFPNMTIEDNLKLGARTKDYEDDLEFVYNIFPEIKKRRKHLAKLTSGGEQQMAAIARALMARPSLLLLDEPSMGLAPIAILRIRDGIMTVRKEKGISILMVEQNIRLAFELADRIYILIKGEIVGEGTSDTLKGLERHYLEKI